MTNLTEKQATNFAQALYIMASRVETARIRMTELSLKLLEHPVTALEWASDDFVHAARIQIYSQVIDTARKPDTKADLFTLLKYAQEQAIRAAMYPQRSTSPCSNLMDQAKGTAWAEVYEWLEGCV